MADVMIYVSNEHDTAQARALIDRVGAAHNGRTAAVSNLYGAEFEAVPGVVLQVMRLKKRGTMPITVADGHPVVSGRIPDEEELLGLLAKAVTEPAAVVYHQDSAVSFGTDSRIHMSWLVNDLSESTRFYEVFFGQLPTKRRDDYVKFELEDPPLHLALSADRKPTPGVGLINHLGIQLKSTNQIAEAKKRYLDAGFHVEEEVQTACCYAVQSKIWVGDPDGNRWELFVTTEPDADEGCGSDCVCYAEIAPSHVGGVPAEKQMRVSI